MIYLDSSALLKLVHEEAESEPLALWLGARTDSPLVSSHLAKTEVLRACRRVNPAVMPDAMDLLGGVDLIPLSGAVVDRAADVGGTMLRTLDALHIASALSIQESLSAFVAYDRRLGDAAAAAGLAVVAPA